MKKIKKEIKETITIIPSHIMTLYVIAIVIMNLLSNKSINLPFNCLALDCGIIVSWLIFLIMDVTIKKYGAKKSMILSIMSLVISLGVSIIFYIASLIPGMWGASFDNIQSQLAINNALDSTFKGNWFIIFGSSLAFVCSAIVNAIANVLIGKNVKDNFKGFAIRSYLSTMVGQITDNLVFALVVSHTLFGWNLTQCITCSLTGAIVEALCELVFIPLGYKIVNKRKK